jgi:G:T/U-mismatch repair DNA glycosylase
MPFTVEASDAGTVKIDPGITQVSDCSGGPVQAKIQFTLHAGENDLCVKVYAPTDTSATQSTIKYTATVTTSGGTAQDVAQDTFQITHPTRSDKTSQVSKFWVSGSSADRNYKFGQAVLK